MSKSSSVHGRLAERGSTLVVSLILLVILTLLVVTNINMTSVNSKIAGNMQYKSEANSAAQIALEQVISSNFTTNPQPLTVPVDINNDGVADYNVQVPAPNCLSALPIKQNQLNPANPDDAGCLADGAVQNAGIVGALSGNSNCSNTQWDVQGNVLDVNGSGVNVTAHQGVTVRVPAGTSC
jgi:hypothetical protein